jgi:DNA-binding winged helix-turn-helix (wHTH) protein/Tfp pilus assembly protein PilF
MPGSIPHIFEFGDFVVDGSKHLLLRNGEPVALTPKVFDTLLFLVQHPGQLVEKDELIRAVWPDTVVEENNLNQNISILRRLLGEERGVNRYIVTVPGRGYRFVAAVRSSAGPAKVAPIGSIAVLPFKPLTTGHRDEALEMGMADTLIAQLSSSRATIVRPLSSVRKYTNLEQDPQAAGRELGVESVLDGSIQSDGTQIRVTVRLTSVADGASLWAGKFDQEFTNVFAVQDTISEKVTSALALRLSQDEKKRLTQRYTDNVEAFHCYLKGRYHIGKVTRPAITKGLEFFQQAIDIDPTYALAYAGLAEAYRRLPITSDVAPKEAFPKAKAAARKALEIDENLVDAHMAMGFTKTWFDWDWAAAEREFKTAIELNPSGGEPHMGYANLLSYLGRYAAALVEGQRAVELDPLSLIVNANLAQFLHWAGLLDEARKQVQKTLEIDPNFWVANLVLGRMHIHVGNYREAIAVLTKAREFCGANSETVSLISYAHAMTGDRASAQAVLHELQSRQTYVPPYNVALAYHGLGDRDQALQWLEQAYQDRDVRLTWLRVESKWDSLRSDPRFVDLQKRVGLG